MPPLLPFSSRRLTPPIYFFLCVSPHLRQKLLRQKARRLEGAQIFSSGLEADLQLATEDGKHFEAFVLLKRENQNLKAQLKEIKQVR